MASHRVGKAADRSGNYRSVPETAEMTLFWVRCRLALQAKQRINMLRLRRWRINSGPYDCGRMVGNTHGNRQRTIALGPSRGARIKCASRGGDCERCHQQRRGARHEPKHDRCGSNSAWMVANSAAMRVG